MSILVYCVVLFVVAPAFGGSPCPPRQNIYPCSCLNIELNKRTRTMYTAITCHRLEDSDALAAISAHLRTVHVDQFQLYDSFWQATNDSKKVIPNDLLKLMKVTAIEIVDTTLSNGFMCESKKLWENKEINRFTVVNNSSSNMIDFVCPKEDGSVYSWVGCMPKLNHIQFSGKLKFVKDVFPTPMKELTELNLSFNQISLIEVKDFENLPQLAKLDLSHNLLQQLKVIYNEGQQNNKLQFLDVSWNSIEYLGDNLFSPLKLLKTFKADHNRIVYLKEEVWKMIPKSLKSINLRDNLIQCGCNIRWMSSFDKKVQINATCASPNDYKGSILRIAVNAVNKRCDESGNFRTTTKKSISATTSKSYRLLL